MKVTKSLLANVWALIVHVAAPAPVLVGLAAFLLSACTNASQPAPVNAPEATEVQPTPSEANPPPAAPAAPDGPPTEIIIYASDLPESALSEFDFWDDPASPNGRMIGTPNEGGDLDPPPENDPHVTFTVPVQSGIPYRCWIHMKVGEPKGVSQANKLWVQFSDAVDAANNAVFQPDTGSFLTAQGPSELGWAWVGCDLEGSEPQASLVQFRTSGEVTVRLQAGMEGVGFDQFLLSPATYLDQPPAEPIVAKAETGG